MRKRASEWGKAAAKVLQESQQEIGNNTNIQALMVDLKECTRTRNLEQGKQLHAEIVECDSIYVANALINMYAKCGSMADAALIFEKMKQASVVSWNVLILGYADDGQDHTALDLFTKMRSEGNLPNSATFVAALKACTSLAVKEAGGLARGKALHNLAVENGCNSNIYVQNTLLDMYSKYCRMADALEVFKSIDIPDIVSWNVLILGYTENGQAQIAMDLLSRMRFEGPVPDSITFVAALKACTCVAAGGRDRGKAVHNLASQTGCTDAHVRSSLIGMYAKCGSIVDARKIFDSMSRPDVVSWNVLILGYADNGKGDTALQLFSRMRYEGPPPSSVTIVAALKACNTFRTNEGDGRVSDRGKAVHSIAVEHGCNLQTYVQNTLIDMYAKFGCMLEAREVFDCMKHRSVVSWNALIMGYTENEQGHSALELFNKMRIEGPLPDSVTFVASLKACTSFPLKNGATSVAGIRDKVTDIHKLAVKNGCNSDVHVQSTLIDVYSKCSSMADAREVFDGMENPDVVSWNVLILGYADNGQGHTSLELFSRMRAEGPAPDSVTFLAVLKACGLVGALEFGRAIHSEIASGNSVDVVLVNCLVDFYAKCGSLVEAQSVFDLHAEARNMITWNALLTAYSSCGDNEAVFRLFKGMQDSGFLLDGVTFLCMLTCCSHAGLVEKGKECFDAMSSKYGIVPTIEHYTCMIDLFGRANRLDDAMILLKKMPFTPDAVCWMTILGACQKWNNVEMGRLAFESLSRLNDRDATCYVLMGQIYRSRGMLLQEQEMMSEVCKNREETP